MQTLLQNFRYSCRSLWNNRAFSLIAILTLGLGIGANVAIFTLIHAVLMESLPVSHPSELYSLGDNKICCDTGQIQDSFTLYSYPLYQHLRENIPEFTDIAAFQAWMAPLGIRYQGRPAESYNGELVSGNYFNMLGVGAHMGRSLNPSDDQLNAPPVAVMSYRTWTENYASDRSIVGSDFNINGLPVKIVGIAPPGFYGETLRTDPPDLWLPLSTEPYISRDNPLLQRPTVFWLYAIGRVKPGQSVQALQSKTTISVQQWLAGQATIAESDKPKIAKMHLLLTPAGGGISGIQSRYGEGLTLVMLVSGLVLLIACANIANLLLARSTGTRLQTAMRVALGAQRSRLIYQMLSEGMVLALAGGIVGLMMAFAGTRAILAMAFAGSRYVPISANPSLLVLGFALLLSLLTGVIFSVVPAWIASNVHPVEAMRGSGRSVKDSAALPQKILVGVQAMLSLVMLIGSGLLTLTLIRLQNQQFGFETNGRLIVSVNPAIAGYTPDRLPGLYQKLDDRLPRIPGVLSASYALHSPFDEWNWGARLSIEGQPPATSPSTRPLAYYNRVSPHYLETIGTRLRRGRLIDEHDTSSSHHVVVINQTFASKFFPNTDPIGKHMGPGDYSHVNDFEIVGVVEDTKYRDEKNPPDPMYFVPMLQTQTFTGAEQNLATYQNWALFIDSIQLRVSGDPASVEPLVRSALGEIDPNLPILKAIRLADRVSLRLNSQRMIARLTMLYGVLALVLACIGLYGVASYMVARRTSEIGIRMALGANRYSVLVMVVRNSLKPIIIGLLLGIPAAVIAGRAMASYLYGVTAYNVVIFSIALIVLLVCAVAAAIIPARRAASIDPIVALRNE